MTPLRRRIQEMAYRNLVAKKNPAGVDVEVEVPVRIGEIHHPLHGRHPGIGAQNIVAAERLLHCVETCLHALAAAHVDGKSRRTAADLFGELAPLPERRDQRLRLVRQPWPA